MKIDLYTKVILTGIFACLCLIVLRDVRLNKTAEAADPKVAQDVYVVGFDLDRNIFRKINSTYPLPVKVEGTADVCETCQ